MIKKIYLAITAIILFSAAAFSQSKGAIKATLVDEKTKEPLAFANVIVMSGGVQVATGTTDFDGNVTIKPLDPGKYNVKAVYVGYNKKEITGVLVSADKTAYITIPLINDGGIVLEEFTKVEYSVPLIDPDTKSGGTVTRENYQNMATKNIFSAASTTAGVYQQDEGSAVNVRGGRSGNTQVFIDGERAIGTTGIPQQGVEQISVILGGLPAQYGDATSGVISVTTRGPQPKFFGGVEAISSQLTDKFGYNFLGFSIGGPIWKKKDSTGVKKPKLGFFLAGEIYRENDPDPSAVGNYRVNDEKYNEVRDKPLIKQENGLFLQSAAFINKNDLEIIKARQNVANNVIRLNPKIDFKVNDNLNITLGGTWDYRRFHSYIRSYALFNSENNPLTTQSTWRTFLRLQQKFGKQSAKEDEKSQSIVKNAYLSFQVGYQKYNRVTEDDTHKDKYFRYGYVGNFKNYRFDNPTFSDTTKAVDYDDNGDGIVDRTVTYNTANGVNWNVAGFDTLLTYSPYNDGNEAAVNYTQQFFNEFDLFPIFNTNVVQGFGGLVNGGRPGAIHNLWNASGIQYPGYVKQDQSIFRITSSFSADIKNHALMIGFEYDQRNYSEFIVQDAFGLWNLSRQLSNRHLADLSTLNPTIDTNATTGEININYLPQFNQLTNFNKNLYEALGQSANSSQYVNIDGLDPDFLKLEMFSPDELLADGNAYVSNFGYDYYGNKITDNIVFDDFMTKSSVKRGDTIFDRSIGAFKPIYLSGYIQDKFDFKDMKFNVGIRIDRYDANQKVLADRYLFKPAYTRGEMSSQSFYNVSGLDKAQGVPDDAVVYLADGNTEVAGYRLENDWYDVNGNLVQNPKVILDKSNGVANPALKKDDAFYAGKYTYSNNAFKDYKPQINVMPRLAFSFPISDVANFFAHYDVLTQRPSDAFNRLDPTQYYFYQQTITQGQIFNNPDLKVEKTIDYEIGFSQILNERKSAALKLSAFYRELRNQIQIQRLNGAYPTDYLTYGNLDFGTVKGFSIEYDMRRTDGFSMNANYTLQFAEGSGSNANGGYNLANTNQPNLRVTLPLDFDQRHTFTTTLDYRFGKGKDYTGPKFTKKKGDEEKVIQILKNVGANMVFRLGSGTPYTRQNQPFSQVLGGVSQNPTIAGSLNGSYLPWQFRADLRIDKSFELEFGKNKPEEERKSANLNVYLQVLNVFNNQNIVAVHPYTGSPTDDGFLNSAQTGQAYINSNILPFGSGFYNGFIDQYNARLLNGDFFNRPRVIRIGVLFDF
jgi:hypothetical protein